MAEKNSLGALWPAQKRALRKAPPEYRQLNGSQQSNSNRVDQDQPGTPQEPALKTMLEKQRAQYGKPGGGFGMRSVKE